NRAFYDTELANIKWHPHRDLLAIVNDNALSMWDEEKGLKQVAPTIAGLVYPYILAYFADGSHVLVGIGSEDWRCAGTPCTTPTKLARVNFNTGVIETADIAGKGRFRGALTDLTGRLIPNSTDVAVIQLENTSNATLSLVAIAFAPTVAARTLW